MRHEILQCCRWIYRSDDSLWRRAPRRWPICAVRLKKSGEFRQREGRFGTGWQRDDLLFCRVSTCWTYYWLNAMLSINRRLSDIQEDQNTSGWRGVYAATIATQLGKPLGVDDMGRPFRGSPPPSARVGFPHRERDNAISDLPEKRESFYFNSHISEVYYSPSHGDAVTQPSISYRILDTRRLQLRRQRSNDRHREGGALSKSPIASHSSRSGK